MCRCSSEATGYRITHEDIVLPAAGATTAATTAATAEATAEAVRLRHGSGPEARMGPGVPGRVRLARGEADSPQRQRPRAAGRDAGRHGHER